MISKDGVPKILDFGLAQITRPEPGVIDPDAPTKSVPPSLTQAGTVMGTTAYMSPEQAEGKPVDARNDLFSFGVVLYEALTGTRPFQGESYVSLISSILKDEPVAITALKPEMPRDVGRIIRRCLQKGVRERYQTALDLRHDLNDVQTAVLTGTVLVDARTMPTTRAIPFWRQPLGIVAIAAAWLLKPLPPPQPRLRTFALPIAAARCWTLSDGRSRGCLLPPCRRTAAAWQ